VSVSRAAQRICEAEIGTGWTWREVKAEFTAREPGRGEIMRHALRGAGDALIGVGLWLKGRSGPITYQQA
jgi:hypothetical protein